MLEPNSSSKLYVVGIGASAGGLEAISQLISQLRPELPCAYVVLQHLSPSYRSMMVEILSRETVLKVKEAQNGDLPEAGFIYVVPANYNAYIKERHLILVTAQPEVVPKPSINQFLISLAAEEGDSAIGIVLSGTGSDGVAGLRAIQAAGGFTFAQTPESAKYDGMPRSAIEAGVADHILPPEDIGARLQQLLETPAPNPEVIPPPDQLDQLLGKLRDKLHLDFSGYKIGTLLRRVRRRQIATSKLELKDYLDWVDRDSGELDALARDILISVTAFFRDREAFAALGSSIQELCKRKPSGGEIRVWVAGCASGEEAYSVAMLIAEALGERLQHHRVQVFATDIDDDALNVARRGIYPAASMAEVPAELLGRYFSPANQAYEAGKLLRDMIVFARHNLVSDPPFLRLDLVSCRNVLIYFDSPLQAKVLQTFHFGLQKEGCLFLGRSESVAQAEQLFTPLDRRERLFKKTGDSAILPGPVNTASFKSPLHKRDHKQEALLSGLVRHYGVTAALIDSKGNIQHTVGKVDHYLQFPVGSTRLSIADVSVPQLRGELLTLLHQCEQTGKPQRGRKRKLSNERFRIYVEPIADSNSQYRLVLFVPDRADAANDEPAGLTPNRALEDELVATREHLQALVEELATANEEMQALNEETQASNEELQATNEELEAANEELQATNEELISLNEELSVKTQELARLTEEYAHLYDALQFPILVFDRACQLIRFNAPAARHFDLRPTALRQHVSRLRLPESMKHLDNLLGSTLAHADRIERAVKFNERCLQLAITPGLDATGNVVTLVATLIDITEISQAQTQLQKSQSRLSALMENTTVIFAMKDTKGDYLYANRRFLEYFDIPAEGYLGKNDFNLLPKDLAAKIWSADLEALRMQKAVVCEHVINNGSETHHLRTVHQSLQDEDGIPTAFITEAEDVTAAKHAEQQLRITARVFEQAGEAIAVTNPKGVIETVNAAFTHITGYLMEESIGHTVGFLLKSGRHSLEFYQSMWQALNQKGYWQGEIWNKRKNGEIFPEWLTINRIDDKDGNPEHFVAVFSDITSIKDSQRKAEYLATHDPLTGLPNRALFQDRLRHSLAKARRSNNQVALLFIDLDNFKNINDSLGHDYGDELLKLAAARLTDVVRDIDTVARLGGDEFTAILSDCNVKTAQAIAQRLLDDLCASFEIDGRSLFISASIGIAFFPEDSNDSQGLIKAADTAMYRAKEQGRNRIGLFKPDMQIKLLKQQALESGLREAIRQKRLRLVYQPKYRIEAGKQLIGAEALLRWHDPELGDISPAEFIPIAESSGFMLDLGEHVLQLLLAQIAYWLGQGLHVPTIALNVSAKSIREIHFANKMLSSLQRYGVAARQIQVEITESALLENSVTVRNNILAIHEAGVGIAIDDFGTGYSSLSYLKHLPLTELKIDKSFVESLGERAEDEAIARAILGLAGALNLKTVAEGVENEQQLRWLQQNGCDIYQGYLFSKPLETDNFEDLLAGLRL
ncbi:EAL domain-containing protein [Methylomonas sp. SURF-1]|uniref:EAL domain-containing protein n=1 Tax=Methylomonas aurea TaxID=2952224 RepID=A0ABT1UGE3_9GAMM|nr:EAL domain-containing protein [Methylomonas sp. SURF-1]MCQ8181307.1 EAL domain-containing protein [Methylomonas sp. SURF-1]